MDFFISLFVLLLIKMIEWSVKLFAISVKVMFWIICLPFKLLGYGINSGAANKKNSYPANNKAYSGPIDKALDRFENHPEDMDLEDLFWIDEILGDD